MSLSDLLAAGRIEEVLPDVETAELALRESARHAESAAAIASTDPNGAYQLAYDASRKAVVAHMRRAGIRVAHREGSHATTAEYARVAIDDALGRRLEAMRRRRNRSEYGTAYFSGDDVTDAIDVARALREAVATA